MNNSIRSLKTLPSVLHLEIAQYLDVESLVALSEVNRAWRALSNSFKTYWIPAVLRTGLLLPLPSYPLWPSFPASQIQHAVRRALYREQNLHSPKPRLYSSTSIQWPFCPRRYIVQESTGPTPTIAFEMPWDVCQRNLSDPSGEFLFFVSSDAVVRVLHLRTGKLVWEKQYGSIIVPFDRQEDRVRFAMDFGDGSAVMALVTDETKYTGLEYGDDSVDRKIILHILQVTLDLQTPFVSFTEANRCDLEDMPFNLDVAGDYVLYSTEHNTQEISSELGKLSLLRWTNKTHIHLPPLLPSADSYLFRGYLFSIGFVELNSMYLQVISLPWQDGDNARSISVSGEKDVSINDEAEQHHTLAASIRLPLDRKVGDAGMIPEGFDIPHVYMGKLSNTIAIWVRVGSPSYGWDILNLKADFSKPPTEWFTKDLTSTPISIEDDGVEAKVFPRIEHRRLWDRNNQLIWPLSAPPGRRFVWLTHDEILINEPGLPHTFQHRYNLRVSLVEHLPLMRNSEDFDEDYLDSMFAQSEGIPVHELEVPEDYELDPENMHIFRTDLEERSGTIISITTTGTVWVLRYGRS